MCGLIVPWNFPFAITTWKVAPGAGAGQLGRGQAGFGHAADGAAAGRAGRRGRRAARRAQRRAGAGRRGGTALARHPDVRKIAFTGSTEVGSEVMRIAAGDVKRVSLELGGKSANLIFADADLEKAGAARSPASFGNAGQDCCARSRVLVERPVYEEIVERFVERTRAMRVGDPLDEATEMGSLISPEHREQGRRLGAPRRRARREALHRRRRSRATSTTRQLLRAGGLPRRRSRTWRSPRRRSSVRS